jgi:hypothetical protein
MDMLTIALLILAQAETPAPVDPEDPGPPVVKRGGNAPRKAPAAGGGPRIITPLPAPEGPSDAELKKPAFDISASVPRAGSDDALIMMAREASADYDQSLPNFVCDQAVTRFRSEAKPPKWKKEDLVEVDLMYVNGAEDYRNVRINGKPLKSGTPEDTGSWSTGDWGTTLMDILSPTTNASFKPKGNDAIAGLDTVMYDFTVEKANSHWTIRYGKPVKPAYKGVIWVDPKTGRVMRTEMQALRLPSDYDIDWVEQMTEYGWVTIAGTKYLLPVKSENIACFRYTTKCTRNEIAYKNYRKFATESTISTTESEISFGDKPVEAPPRKKKD